MTGKRQRKETARRGNVEENARKKTRAKHAPTREKAPVRAAQAPPSPPGKSRGSSQIALGGGVSTLKNDGSTKPRRFLTPLEVSLNNMTIPVSVYNNGVIKDLEHHPFSLQGPIHKRVHALFGGKEFTPFFGQGRKLNNTARPVARKGQRVHLHFKHGSVSIDLYHDGKIKDFSHYPPPIRAMIVSSLSKKGVHVEMPVPDKIQTGSRVDIRLLMGDLGFIDVGVSPDGKLRTEHMAPNLRRAVQEKYGELISGAPKAPVNHWKGASRTIGNENTVETPPIVNTRVRNAVRSKWQEKYSGHSSTRPRRAAAIAGNNKRRRR